MRLFSILVLAFLLTIPTTVSGQFIQQTRPQLNYLGNWDSTASYNSNDAVRGSNGNLYVAVEDNVPVNTNPVGSTRYWASPFPGVIARGETGLTGQAGEDGTSHDWLLPRIS